MTKLRVECWAYFDPDEGLVTHARWTRELDAWAALLGMDYTPLDVDDAKADGCRVLRVVVEEVTDA